MLIAKKGVPTTMPSPKMPIKVSLEMEIYVGSYPLEELIRRIRVEIGRAHV